MPYRHFDLRGAAERWLLDAGFETVFSPEVLAEADSAHQPDTLPDDVRDLRHLLWSSVDNVESRDLDQIEVAERLPDGDIRVLVGIADVDALVPRGSATSQRAGANATTVYGGVAIWPMLPEALSCGKTSLHIARFRLKK